MSSVLGPNVRVWIGWTPTEFINERCREEPRLRKGTVIDGPFGPGALRNFGHLNRKRMWLVFPDGGIEMLFIAEHMLTPLDGGEPERVEEEREVETT